MGNSIPTEQNSPPFLRLLRARSQIYSEAVRLQWAQLILTVLAPVLGAIAGMACPDTRPWVAVSALAITICDVSWLDRAQRLKLRLAAKISEQFDCELLKMPWNPFIAGKRIDPEAIESAARAWKKGDDKLVDWYPPSTGAADLHLARIVCQRANLRYDSRLRRSYSVLLVAVSAIIFGILFAIGLVLRLSLMDFAVTILTPAAPTMIWAIRDFYRQRDAAEALEFIKAEAEAVWEQAIAGGCREDICASRSREFQDAIYGRRTTNPLLFPFIYYFLRPGLETEMNAGAAELLKAIGQRN